MLFWYGESLCKISIWRDYVKTNFKFVAVAERSFFPFVIAVFCCNTICLFVLKSNLVGYVLVVDSFTSISKGEFQTCV